MKIISTLLLLFHFSFSYCQDNSKVKDAIATFNDGEMTKGITAMRRIIEKDPADDNWDVLIEMLSYRYLYANENELTDVILESLGGKKKNSGNPPSSICLNEFVNECRNAGLTTQNARASQYLRNYFVDYYPDTSINKSAKIEFDTAETFFIKKDFENAIRHYRQAIYLEPNYYKANIYLGDSYWHSKKMDSAIYYFSIGISMYPDLLEPRKYLVDALIYDKRYSSAVSETMDAILIYPDAIMYVKLGDALKEVGKKFDKHWIKRECHVNSMKNTTEKTKDKTWLMYQQAKNEIKDLCDKDGIIIKPNDLTQTQYMEVYSFEKMIKSLKEIPEELKFAKKMMDEGFLDCYVFISVFHFDLYRQFKHFSLHNKEKIKNYFEKYLIK